MLRALATALLVALPGSALATTFVYDAGAAIATGKSDFHVRSDVPSNEKVTALDWNGYGQAIYDLRTALKFGYFHGLAPQTVAPPPPATGILFFNIADGGGLWIEYPDAGTALVSTSIAGSESIAGVFYADGGYLCPLVVRDGTGTQVAVIDCSGVVFANVVHSYQGIQDDASLVVSGHSTLKSVDAGAVRADHLYVHEPALLDGGAFLNGLLDITPGPNDSMKVHYGGGVVVDVTRDTTTLAHLDAGDALTGTIAVTSSATVDGGLSADMLMVAGTHAIGAGDLGNATEECNSPSFLIKLDGGPAICVGYDETSARMVTIATGYTLAVSSGGQGVIDHGAMLIGGALTAQSSTSLVGGKASASFEFDAGATLEGFPAVAYGVNGTGKALWGIQAGRASASSTGQVVNFAHAFLSPVYCTCSCKDLRSDTRCDPNDDGSGATNVTLYSTTTCSLQWVCVGAETQ